MNRFTGRVSCVTGAARGIGFSIAKRFATEGGSVAVVDIDEPAAVRVAKHIHDEHDADVLGIGSDVSTKAGAEEMVRSVIDHWGRLDVLVNNAGGGVIRPTLEHTDETIRTTIDRNLWTTIWCTLAALPTFLEQGYGRVVNVGAESVRNGLYDHAIYNAAKGGVHAMCTALAREFSAKGVTFNTVAPSIVMTDAVREALESSSDHSWFRAIDLIPMGRAASLEEVASAVAYLASEEAGFITGQVVSVNGGSSMG